MTISKPIFYAGVVLIIISWIAVYFVTQNLTSKPQNLSLNDSERQFLYQEARIGYISKDSLDYILSQIKPQKTIPSKSKIVIQQKTDTVEVHDTIRIIPKQIPYYESTQIDTSHFSFKKNNTIIDFDVAVRPKFYPPGGWGNTSGFFLTDIWIKNFKMELVEAQSFNTFWWGFFGGAGAMLGALLLILLAI